MLATLLHLCLFVFLEAQFLFYQLRLFFPGRWFIKDYFEDREYVTHSGFIRYCEEIHSKSSSLKHRSNNQSCVTTWLWNHLASNNAHERYKLYPMRCDLYVEAKDLVNSHYKSGLRISCLDWAQKGGGITPSQCHRNLILYRIKPMESNIDGMAGSISINASNRFDSLICIANIDNIEIRYVHEMSHSLEAGSCQIFPKSYMLHIWQVVTNITHCFQVPKLQKYSWASCLYSTRWF